MTANRRSRRILTSAAMALSLTFAATISPAFADSSGHPRAPLWTMTAVAVPGTVSAGDVVAFDIIITNNRDKDGDPVALVATTPAGATFLGASMSAGSCLPGASLACTTDLIAVGTSRTARAVYRAPSTGSSFAVTFLANGDDDAFNAAATAALSSDPNFASRYVFDSSGTQVFTDQAIGGTNPQSTLVNSPTTGIVVSAAEGAGTAVCPSIRPCFSQESQIHVGGGATYPGGFKVVIKLDASEIPYGIRWWNIGVAHQFDNGSWEILSRCSCEWWESPPNHIPCYTARPLWGGDIEITVWLTQNGKLRGF
jgi:hypothetical protein